MKRSGFVPRSATLSTTGSPGVFEPPPRGYDAGGDAALQWPETPVKCRGATGVVGRRFSHTKFVPFVPCPCILRIGRPQVLSCLRYCDMLARFRLAYVGDPAVLHLPHGLDRARLAYAVYLGEARDGDELISFEEARRHFRAWSGEKPTCNRGKRKNGQMTPTIRDVRKVQNPPQGWI